MSAIDEIIDLIEGHTTNVFYFDHNGDTTAIRKSIEAILRQAHEDAYSAGFTHGYDEALAGSW